MAPTPTLAALNKEDNHAIVPFMFAGMNDTPQVTLLQKQLPAEQLHCTPQHATLPLNHISAVCCSVALSRPRDCLLYLVAGQGLLAGNACFHRLPAITSKYIHSHHPACGEIAAAAAASIGAALCNRAAPLTPQTIPAPPRWFHILDDPHSSLFSRVHA